MKINRNNYEPYFIDYLDGILDEKLVDDFLEFLQQNPDLKEELSLFNSVHIEPEELDFDKKELMFKENFDLEKEFNKAAVSLIEGDISEEDKEKFENYISNHPEKEKDIALFKATKLKPDTSITFRKKSKLYHRSTGRAILLWSVRIAAVLILALTFYVVVDKSSNNINPENQLAKVEDETPKNEKSVESKPVQQEKEKQEPEKSKVSVPEPAKKEIKKVVPEQKPGKSLRENSKGRIEHEDIASVRIPLETPAEMKTIAATLDAQKPEISLGTMYIRFPDAIPYEEERFLADVVVEKTGLDKLSIKKITKAGLNIVTGISNEKFKYETNEEGKVTEYNYDSRLFAFTIPSKNKTNDK